MKLNLGAGGWEIPGFKSLDRKTGQEVYPLDFADNSIDEIRASHILEHFSHTITPQVIAEWVRVLKPGGILSIAVPNFAWIAEKYLAGEDHKYMGYLYGGHTDADDRHEAIFDEEELRWQMEKCGLTDIKPWQSEIKDCASLPVSLNLQGTKREYQPPEEEDYSWLQEKAYNRYSQAGEDGILEAIFEKIGPTNKQVIECGAGDPIQHSNSRKLIEEGWSATLIEADAAKSAKLAQQYAENPEVSVIHAAVSDDLEALYSGPENPDLLVLDVDGQEYYIWNSLITLRPRVVMCEFAPDAEPSFIPPKDGDGQAGRDATIRLGLGKSYALIGQVGVNLVFVQRGLEVDLNVTGKFDVSRIGKEVRACLSSSRLMFADTVVSVMTALVPLGVMLEINTGVFWGQSLTKMLEAHIEQEGLKYYLTLDFDTLFMQRDVLELYRLMETHPEIDVLCSLQMRREGETPLLTVCNKAGHAVNELQIDPNQEVMPINSAHFGLTMIRVESLKKTRKPWFIATVDEKGEYGPDHMDEDVYFWHNLKQSGLQAYQANHVSIGHLQLMATWPTFIDSDLCCTHQYLKDWYEKGKPEGAR